MKKLISIYKIPIQARYKILVSILLFLKVFNLNAQIKPDASIAVPNATGTVTTPYQPTDYDTGTLVNYIRTWQPQQPTADAIYVGSSSRSVDEVNVTTQYFDGLGRPLQTVNWQASPDKKDMVAPVVYDEFGRETYQFLPYTSPTASASGNPGQFKMNPFSEQSTFYTNTYKTEQPAIANEKYFYNKTNFEPSPLNRISESYAPGNSWAGSEGGSAEKKVSVKYLVNTRAADAVRIWHIYFNTTIANNTNIPYTDANDANDTYADGQLYKTVTLDEAGNATVEYKDKEGQVILKKVQIGTIATDYSGYSGFLCTYYVYDDLNQLRFVMQPKAVAILSQNGWVIDSSPSGLGAELCFRYEYDSRQRMIAKKVPGSGWVYMVYDVRDRLAFSQDANMNSKHQWMYTMYDDLNRPIQTGIMNYLGNRETLQAAMPTTSSSSTVTNTGTGQTINPADLYINGREYGRTDYKATTSIVFDNGFISEDNASFTAEIVTEAANNFSDGNVTVNTFYKPNDATLIPLTYTYYDDYAATAKTYSPANNPKLDAGGNPYPETLPSTKSDRTRGMVTVTKVRVIEDPNNLTLGKWLETVNFYDDKGRVIQVQSTNYKGGNDIVTNRYDFTGKVVSTYVVHENVSGNVSNMRVLTSMNYDHAGRLKTVTKKINDDDDNKRVIATNSYDALGKLKNKKTGQKSATDATALEDDNYNYNIRGWLKDINWYSSAGSYASQMDMTNNKWFSMDLSYDWGFDNNASQYNGNISGTRWKTAGDGEERAYGFAYDKANRLLKGDFNQNDSGWNNSAIDFSMQIGNGVSTDTYDENGNIIKMSQKGITGVQSNTIDDLTYHYFANTNKLSSVDDTAPIADTKLGDFTDNHKSTDDYGYDVNGNLVTDLNKRMNGTTGSDLTSGGAITYNFLNLPWQINVKNTDGSAKGTITYIYDAIGNKLEKRTNEVASSYNNNTAKQTITSYLGSFVYENNVLQFFSHEEGRERYKADNHTYVYDYFLKDHLGNVRMVLTEEQKTDIYPVATLEGTGAESPLSHEEGYYDINESYVVDKPANVTPANLLDYINDNGTNNPNTFGNKNAVSQKMYRLNAATNRTGLGRILKVMTGDKINILAKSYYHYSSGTIAKNNLLATDIINAFIAVSGGGNAAVAHGATTTMLNNNNTGLVVPLGNYSDNNSENVNNHVKAGISYIILDERFNYVTGGYDPVNTDASGGIKNHFIQNIAIPKNGYIYIYCSNESNIDVFFDNLEVVNVRGPLVEETHYYPFGLTMAGISASAFGGVENKYKYNKSSELQNKEFSDGSGLELYATNFRSLDPQLGRWWQIDPKPDYRQSMYSAMNNNPISFNDPLGDTIRVDESIMGNKLLNSSFNAFSATKAGRQFLSNYAAKGQTIGGHEFKKEGKYSKQGIDVSYGAESFEKNKGGETTRTIDDAGRGQINVSVNSNFYEKTTGGLVSEAFGKVGTLFHESFIHVDLSTKDYLDNKQFDYSNISQAVKNAAGYREHYQHYQVLMDYMKNGYNSSNLWPGPAFNGMKQLNDILKVYPSEQGMLNEMWNYNGGIQLDEKGNVKK